MKRQIIEKNFKDDFDFILRIRTKDGKDIGFPEYDFEGRIISDHHKPHHHHHHHLPGHDKAFVFSSRKGVVKNCFNDEGKLHIVMNNHGLLPGKLMLDFVSYLEDSIYEDGYRKVCHEEPLMIELVHGPGDTSYCIHDEEMVLPYIYKTAYELAVAGGFEGTQEEFEAALSQVGSLYEMASDNENDIRTLKQGVANCVRDIQKTDHRLATLSKRIELDLRTQNSKINEFISQTQGEIGDLKEIVDENSVDISLLKSKIKDETERALTVEKKILELMKDLSIKVEATESDISGLKDADKQLREEIKAQEEFTRTATQHVLNDANHYTDDKTHLLEDEIHSLQDEIDSFMPVSILTVRTWFPQ